MLNKAILTLLTLLFFILSLAQSPLQYGFTMLEDGTESCGKTSIHEQRMASDPVYRYATERAEEQIYQTLIRQQKGAGYEKNNDNC
ncbi:MAG: hypothetical protein AAFO82_00575, partial [Bacteroidota bacterium]